MFINGEFVDDAVVRQEASEIKRRWGSDDGLAAELNAREAAREAVIERVLIRQAALKFTAPLSTGETDAALLEFLKRSGQNAAPRLPRDMETLRFRLENALRVEALAASIQAKVPKPTRKQVASFYEASRDSLETPETVHAAHIVKNIDESMPEDRALAATREIAALLERGMPFEKAADEYSDCPGRGGDLNFIARGQMVAEFEEAVFGLAAQAVSGIFRTPFGFHIAKVYERRAARVPALNEIRTRLEESLWDLAKKEAFRSYVRELRSRAEVRRSK